MGRLRERSYKLQRILNKIQELASGLTVLFLDSLPRDEQEKRLSVFSDSPWQNYRSSPAELLPSLGSIVLLADLIPGAMAAPQA